MGREIRRVPANWQHPTHERCPHNTTCRPVCYRPLFDQDYDSAAREWLDGLLAWEADKAGERTKAERSKYYERYFWDWHGRPPDKDSYRADAWTPEQATHFQMYETVSEGTPVSPVFATRDELIDYLMNHGDFWDQQRGEGGWRRENAERFVGVGYAPSLVVTNTAEEFSVKAPRDGA